MLDVHLLYSLQSVVGLGVLAGAALLLFVLVVWLERRSRGGR